MPSRASDRLGPEPAEVWVALLPDEGDPAADHRMLAALAAPLAPSPGSAVTVTHRCPACGSSAHGRPLLTTAGGTTVPGVHLSLSRAAGTVALAATLAGPVGIDIESLDAVTRAGFDDVAFDTPERAALRALTETRGPAAADRMRALAWSAKEAVLKAAGTGLRADPAHISIDFSLAPTITLRDDPRVTLAALDTPAGLLGTVAVFTDSPLRIRWPDLSPENT